MVTAAGALRGELSLRLPQNATLSMSQVFLSEAQEAAAEFKPEYREAAEELLRQVAGQAATALQERFGEVHFRLQFGESPSWPAAATGWIVSAAAAPCRLWLEWQMSAALQTALRAPQPAPSATLPGVVPPEAQAGSPPEPRLSPDPTGKLDLLMDVAMDVTLRFGGRRMLLREILELGPGTVVELDRQVREPADLLLDGKLIARGEVVVVDGNYGLRVLELVSALSSG